MDNLTWLQMLEQITSIVKENGPMGAALEHKQTIISLLERYQPNKCHFQPYVHFDESGYTKNLVKDIGDGSCNVIVMCWSPNQSSAFHAHEGSRCFVKVLVGKLKEQQVSYPKLADGRENINLEIGPSGDKILNYKDVTYIDDSIGLHKVTNESTSEPAITLHVYMPAYKKARIFATGEKNMVVKKVQSVEVRFNSIHGVPTN